VLLVLLAACSSGAGSKDAASTASSGSSTTDTASPGTAAPTTSTTSTTATTASKASTTTTTTATATSAPRTPTTARPGTTSPPPTATPTTAAPSTTTTSTTVAAAPAAITVKNFAFSPSTVHVARGATVTVTNQDGFSHTWTADDGSWNDPLSAGGSASRRFDTDGTFTYHCAIHSSMTGSVVVSG